MRAATEKLLTYTLALINRTHRYIDITASIKRNTHRLDWTARWAVKLFGPLVIRSSITQANTNLGACSQQWTLVRSLFQKALAQCTRWKKTHCDLPPLFRNVAFVLSVKVTIIIGLAKMKKLMHVLFLALKLIFAL